ncbi:hypothetical protein [Pseudomonas frederiksbergensis]|uniref:hypothetical protein n=1 Tax=Pseudomonas frederiksbergensis TaxID=104087 RepID=UPI003D1BBB77
MRTVFADVPPCVEYEITAKARARVDVDIHDMVERVLKKRAGEVRPARSQSPSTEASVNAATLENQSNSGVICTV